ELGYRIGLASRARYERMLAKKDAIERTRHALNTTAVTPEQVNGYLEKIGTAPIEQPERIARLALRPQVSVKDLLTHADIRDSVVTEAPGLEPVDKLVEIELKYAGYVEREQEMVRRMEHIEEWTIPEDFDFRAVKNITMEAREKLSKIHPENLGQASRISGVSPADISVLMILLKKNGTSTSNGQSLVD